MHGAGRQMKRPGMGRHFGPVHLAYNASYSACFFSQNNIFLSQKSANSVF
jgi:hypothetical protein